MSRKPQQGEEVEPSTVAKELNASLKSSQELTRNLNAVLAARQEAATTSEPRQPANPASNK